MQVTPLSVLSVAILAGVAAAVPAWNRAEAAWCPGRMEQYCVLSRDGVEFVAWIKPCFAQGEGLRILHRGPHGQPY
jgi:hypothetical protein